MRFWIIGMLLFVAATVSAQDNPPNQIQILGENASPEGLECDPENERFLVSSLAEGTVYEVAYDGTAAPYLEDDELISSVGLEFDPVHNRLLVVNSDLKNFDDAFLGIYDFTAGTRLHMVDLAALVSYETYFPNDVALDPNGTAYVTDSLAPVIYRVDVDGNASVLVQDDRLLIEDFGGNGIVYHPDDYLLVGISGLELYKIPLDNPEDFIVVDTAVTVAADGMLWDANDDSLIVVSDGRVLRLVSDDDWVSAQVTASARNHPATTAAFCGEDVYVIHPQENEIVRVQFQ